MGCDYVNGAAVRGADSVAVYRTGSVLMCLYFLNELKMHRQPDVLCYVYSALSSC